VINKKSKIFVAGHNGMIGSAILRALKLKGYKNIFFIDKKKLDLRDQTKVFNYIKRIKPDGVIIAAATVGGIDANNTYKADFIYNNLMIQNNLIHGSYLNKVKDLIFLGSSCVYPKNSKQPIKEEYLLSSYLEKTNEPYAIAKIAGIKMCSSYNFQYNLNYKCLMPCNSYGINDNYNLKKSHFLPALIKKIIDAVHYNKDYIKIWGSGKPLRELIFCEDVADACIYFLKKKTKHNLINIGTGKDKSINYYAKFIMKHLGVNLKIINEKNKLDGTFKKLLDVSLAKKYGWKAKTSLDKGISLTINDYLENVVLKNK
jgi:GDP-L-fucose synthase